MYHWHTGDKFGILLRQKNSRISARETNRTKNSMSTTAQTYWQSSAKIWEGQRNYSRKNQVHKDAISCFSIRKDWRFAVRAKSFALHWRSRGFFRGHVRSCEKGLIDWRPAVCRSKGFHQARRRLSHITTTTAQTTNAYSHHHRDTPAPPPCFVVAVCIEKTEKRRAN